MQLIDGDVANAEGIQGLLHLFGNAAKAPITPGTTSALLLLLLLLLFCFVLFLNGCGGFSMLDDVKPGMTFELVGAALVRGFGKLFFF